MKKVLLIIVLSFITKVNYAQSDSSKLSSNGMIQYSRGGFFSMGQFSIDGKPLTRNEIYAKLMSYSTSANEFKKYKTYKRLTTYTGVASISFLLAAIVANGSMKTIKGTTPNALLGVGYGLIIPVVVFG